MEEQDDMYVFDPSSGCICTLCNVGVTHERGIPYHERLVQHIKHGRRPTTDSERQTIFFNFCAYIDWAVTQVQSCLQCIETANATFLSLIGKEEEYDYCSRCDMLLYDKKKHNSRSCSLYIAGKKTGVRNEKCTTNIVIVDGFDITDNKCLERFACQQFIEKWQD